MIDAKDDNNAIEQAQRIAGLVASTMALWAGERLLLTIAPDRITKASGRPGASGKGA